MPLAAPVTTAVRPSSSSMPVIESGGLLVDDGRIVEVGPTSVPDDAVVIDLGDLTLLPGLMDMEVNLLLGAPTTRARSTLCRTTRPCGRCAPSPTPGGPCGPGSRPSAAARRPSAPRR